jgi:hypothetical protein
MSGGIWRAVNVSPGKSAATLGNLVAAAAANLDLDVELSNQLAAEAARIALEWRILAVKS